MRIAAGCVAFLSFTLLTPLARAQWVTFVDQTSSRLVASASLGTNDAQEKDYAWADFDQDGDTDLVCVRKEPASTGGHYPNVLFMNENGVLTDRTQQYASAALVAGSQGMLDATNDRDVVVADVNGDGWVDLVTCTTLTFGQPQYIRVPRVYVNRGDDLVGNWLGFLYDDPLRIDDLQPGASWNGEHRFCAVAAGDVDGDGDLDLFFGDYDRGSVSVDVNDRLLLNNGAGYFTDVTATHLPAPLSTSNFTTKAVFVDLDNDGRLDIARNNVSVVDATYNDGASVGVFSTRQTVYAGSAYQFNVGDLNNDNLPDIIVSDDGQDRYLLHAGVVGGVATWSPSQPFTYTGGGNDDGFAGTSIIADLDNDGWNDVVITDFDVDTSACNRRTHIYRNLGNAPAVTLQEQQIGNAVCGIPTGMLAGTFDVAVFDIDGDGWKDMVIGRCSGTKVWMNVPPIGITFSYPNGLPAFVPAGAPSTLDVNATGIGLTQVQTGSGRVHWSIDGAPFQSAPMLDLAPGQFRATLPAMPQCTDAMRFYVTVDSTAATTYLDPPTAPATYYTRIAGSGIATIYETGFEAPVPGWSVVNTSLAAGAWEIAVPNFTIFGSNLAAPPTDAENSPTATRCWVTLNGPTGAPPAANWDVDGGPTDLISPPLHFAGSDGTITYRRWFFSSTAEDTLEVAVSNDGSNWVVVESVPASGNNQWLQRQFRVGAFVVPNGSVRVRFRTADLGAASTVEAAIDAFRAEAFTCLPCQQAIALPTNGNAVLSVCGGDLSPGTGVTLQVVSMPESASGLLLFDLPLVPTPWNGGTLLTPGPIVLGPVLADVNGTFAASLPIGGLLPPGWSLHTQVVYNSAPLPFGIGQTNAVRLAW